MNFTELCPQCRSIHTYEINLQPIPRWLLKMAGCQLLGCNNCGYRWKKFLPMQPLLNLIYLFLAVEAVLLILSYYQGMAFHF